MKQTIPTCRGSRRHTGIWQHRESRLNTSRYSLFSFFSLRHILPTTASQPKNLLFNLPIWSLLTGVTLPFQYPVIHHVSITNTLGQGKNSALGNGWIKQQVLRGRWSTLASGCSSQLLSDLEYIKKLGDPQPLGSCTVKKNRKIHLSASWIMKILAYSL